MKLRIVLSAVHMSLCAVSTHPSNKSKYQLNSPDGIIL